MKQRLLVLTHSDFKDPLTGKLEQVYVDIELIGLAFAMPTKGGTAVMLNGGATVLVQESAEFVMNSKMKYLGETITKKEGKNGKK